MLIYSTFSYFFICDIMQTEKQRKKAEYMKAYRQKNIEREREKDRVRCAKRRKTKEYQEYHLDYRESKGLNSKIVGYFVECDNCGKIIKKPLCRIIRHDNITCSKKCGYEIREFIPWNKGKQFSTKAKDRNYKRHREFLEYKNWHDDCLKRDWYKCQLCSSKDRIEVHHIKSYKDYQNDRVDINNGITLCKSCHLWVHNFNMLAQQ
jgi:5-methylcytosine-specific restriction endonuclease McrA